VSIYATQYIITAGGLVDTSNAPAMRTALGLGSASLVASTAFSVSGHGHDASSLTAGTLAVSRGGTGLSTAGAGSLVLGNGTNAMTLLGPGAALTVPLGQGTESAPIMANVVGSGAVTIAQVGNDLRIHAEAGGGGTGYIEQVIPLAAMRGTADSPLLLISTTGTSELSACFTDGRELTPTESLTADLVIPSGAATTGNATISGLIAAKSATTGTLCLSVGTASIGGSSIAWTNDTPVNASGALGGSVSASLEIPMVDLGSPGQNKLAFVRLKPSKPENDVRTWLITGQSTGSTLTNASIYGTSAQMTISGATWTASSAPSLPWNTGNYVLSFDGVNDYCYKDLVAADTSAAMTVDGWVNIKATAAYSAIVQFLPRGGSTPSATNMFQVDTGPSGNSLRFVVGSTVSSLIATTSSTLSLNTWYHFAARTDGSNAALFINGSSVASGTHSPIIWAGAGSGFPVVAKVFVGASHYNGANDNPTAGSYSNTLQCDLRHYKRSLANAEIANLAAGQHEDGSTSYVGGSAIGDGVLLAPGITIKYPEAS